MRFILIRHGESEANADLMVFQRQPDHTIELTQKGHDQARSISTEVTRLVYSNQGVFSDYQVFVSPYKRALQTLAGIESYVGMPKPSLPTKEDPLLREHEYDSYFTRRDSDSVSMKNYGYFWWRWQNAESQADVYLRIRTFLNSLVLDHIRGKLSSTIVIVAHGVSLRIMANILEGRDFNHHYEIGNCEPIVIDNPEMFK